MENNSGNQISEIPTILDTPLLNNQHSRLLCELLSRTLTFALAPLLCNAPELAAESEALGSAILNGYTDANLEEIGNRIRQLCFRIELKSGDINEQQEMLLNLFKLLLDNVAYLIDDENWLRGQAEIVQNLIAGPIHYYALENAALSLKEIIYKQGALKDSLSEVKIAVQNMTINFIDCLNSFATSINNYHNKITIYTEKIAQTEHSNELSSVLAEVIRETHIIQTETLHSCEQILVSQQQVSNATVRIKKLETELSEVSTLASHDQLTHSLNRRGLDEAFKREQARADRYGTALCGVALHLDNFKQLYEVYGHPVGDETLINVVKIFKATLRSMDVIGRLGGEEFVLLLPDTDINEAVSVINRLQAALTKRIFLHDKQRFFITFSAGIALRTNDEVLSDTIKRADSRLRLAQKTGKNQIMTAD